MHLDFFVVCYAAAGFNSMIITFLVCEFKRLKCHFQKMYLDSFVVVCYRQQQHLIA
jgi:hypothetical protein